MEKQDAARISLYDFTVPLRNYPVDFNTVTVKPFCCEHVPRNGIFGACADIAFNDIAFNPHAAAHHDKSNEKNNPLHFSPLFRLSANTGNGKTNTFVLEIRAPFFL
ncbi:MAG: hypothetical protein NUV42_02970 [Candidatus Yonathbacteria bacterium]|nr:hypothetical protein [Candidatus Yonathbacteria bacterium]